MHKMTVHKHKKWFTVNISNCESIKIQKSPFTEILKRTTEVSKPAVYLY